MMKKIYALLLCAHSLNYSINNSIGFVFPLFTGRNDLPACCKPEKAVSAAVTYTFSGGRFGDNLMAYLHAKWIAYKHGIPLLYKPFDYSLNLKLHSVEKMFDERMVNEKFSSLVALETGLRIDRYEPILYVIPYFPECIRECQNQDFPRFDVDWSDVGFRKLLQQLVQPNYEIRCALLPKDKITVALHVRKNSDPGADYPPLWDENIGKSVDLGRHSNFLDIAYPLKVAPNSYYIEQLRWLSEYFNHQPLYVYVFTDDLDPKRIVDYYAEELKLPNIEFAYREAGNCHTANVLEDFFFMTKFDCLIRSQSNYSLTNACIFDYKVMVSPENYCWREGRIYINEVKRVIKDI